MTGQPVRVMINDRCLRNVRTGVGHYVSELLAAMPGAAPDIAILPFYRTYLARRSRTQPSPSTGSAPPGRPRRAPDWLRRVLQGSYETLFEAAGALRGYGLYHEPNHIPGPWNGPVVTTVHDLSVLRHPEWHPPDRVRWYERDFTAALPRSAHFISVSEFTRREMVTLLGLEPDRITVIPLGPRAVFHPRPPQTVQAWLANQGLPPQYLLFVGTAEPRKNAAGLLAAYGRLPDECRRRFPLLMAGAGGWGPQLLDDQIREAKLTGQVRTLGYVTDEDLSWLYAGAQALVWPTLYEGFGLPPLECMATGTPVIAGNATSLPEVVGDAGLLVDAHDPEQLTQAMRCIIDDTDLARNLAERGLAQSQMFSWKRCAADHAAVYRRYAD